MTREDRFDYIVVGTGSAGCVLAARLTEAPDVRVLLLEAGGIDRHPLMKMPLGFFPMMKDPRVSWGYVTEPEPGLDGRVLPLPRGKLLGGSSSINGMLYGRGHPQDYELWKQQGCEGWSWAEVLPYFKRSESNWRGATAYHGGSGPLTVSRHETDPTLFNRLMETASRRGYPVATDLDGSEYEGFGIPDFTIHKGHRGSTAKRYLEPVAHRSNLKVWLKSHVTRVLLEGRRAVGVEVYREGKLQKVRAEREVLLSAGAYGSPQILMLSGIGPADELQSVGVPPVHDLRGVGANLQEHTGVGATFAAREPIRLIGQMRLDRMALSVIRWRLFGTGVVAHLPLACIAFCRTRPELQRPDVEFMVNATGMDARIWFPGIRKPLGNALQASNILLHPQSRGWVKLRSSSPKDSPRIQLNILTEEADRKLMRAAFQDMRTFFRTPPATELVVGERFPGSGAQTDAEIDAHMRATAATAHHPASTCAMGTGRDAVLDAKMRVHGIEALRVIDASAMPQVVGGHTNAVTIMMAEKGADLVRGRSISGLPAG
jgi:choline dehydrogenase